MKSCCQATEGDSACKRITDGKEFDLPRKYTKKRCMSKIAGFTMRSSCAPYKGCKKKKDKTKKKSLKGEGKKQFLFNPDDPKKSFDVYIDKDPSDTIPIKYTTLQDVKRTIRKLERLFKGGKYPHKRIWQVGMILRVRLKYLKKKKPEEYKLAERYFKFLGQRTKLKTFNERKKFTFKI